MSIFGPLIITDDVDAAVLATLKLWLPTYLTQTERERVLGQDWLKRPKDSSYANVLDDDTFPDFVLPAVLVTTDGTTGDIERTGGAGLHSAWWHFVVTAIVRGPDEASTKKAASLYAGSIRRLLLQKQSLGGFAGGMQWVSELVTPVADTSDRGRNLAAGIGTFHVLVNEVAQDIAGPTQPTPEQDPHDYGDWPEAEKVVVDVVAVPIEASPVVLAGVDEIGPWIDSDVDSNNAGEDGNGVWVATTSSSPLVGVDGTGPWIEDE